MKQKKAKLCGKMGAPCNFRLGRRRKTGGHEAKKIAQLCAEKGGPMKPKKHKAKLCGKKVAHATSVYGAAHKKKY